AVFQLFPRMMTSLLLQLSKLASNVSCLTIQHRCISSTDLTWMVQNNHLSCKASCFHWWVIFAVNSHIAMTNIFDRHVADIEAHMAARKGFTQCFLVHFSRLHFSCYIDWSQGDHHAGWRTPLQHVVIIPARNWHYCYCVRVVANFLNVGADFLNNFLVSLLAVGWLSGIHFVNSNN
ncbi:hypothetical protein FD755_002998, partial [Muntiacus reevesi]